MNIRVLIVDDSSTMRKIIGRALKSIGVTDIVEACDGVEALRLFNQDVQFVMLDWSMPGKNGLEVLREIRGQGSNVPVMMVTTEVERSSHPGDDGSWCV